MRIVEFEKLANNEGFIISLLPNSTPHGLQILLTRSPLPSKQNGTPKNGHCIHFFHIVATFQHPSQPSPGIESNAGKNEHPKKTNSVLSDIQPRTLVPSCHGQRSGERFGRGWGGRPGRSSSSRRAPAESSMHRKCSPGGKASAWWQRGPRRTEPGDLFTRGGRRVPHPPRDTPCPPLRSKVK